MSGRAFDAQDARERYLRALHVAWPHVTALAPGTPVHHPRPAPPRAPAPALTAPVSATVMACAWTPGRWGKGFLSASGRRYTWVTEHPALGGRPPHSAQQALITRVEGAGVLAAGRQLTDTPHVGYLTPIIIAPDGSYTLGSTDALWKADGDQAVRRARLADRFDAGPFAALTGLQYTRDRQRWLRDSDQQFPAPRR